LFAIPGKRLFCRIDLPISIYLCLTGIFITKVNAKQK
jgi:hypothetical protein